ncbi:ribonuclease P protein component [Thioalkalivibrio sp. ALJ24]|uniref:ribonuclease P protein component n=1 Tax=Thioalkalivibrio sp. ALJ24 TaxID=545276 RepID=UPI0004772139|nr:ribonuclease P protein component [Thioalkalivibrio sp. ALJ24]
MPAYPVGQGFPRAARLLTGGEYRHVFDDARRVRGRHLTLLHRRRVEAGPARLGLAIGKRHVRLAVQRNRIKRIAREAFRLRRGNLPGVDLIVLARGGAGDLDRRTLRREIDDLLNRIR